MERGRIGGMNDSQSDALEADALKAWLAELPFWCEVDARREFVDDLLWQLGADHDSGWTGQPEQGPSDVADPRYAACRDADPATAAAAVAELCTGGVTAAGASASDVLLASVRDRGVDIDVPFRVSPLAGLSGDATPAAGASVREPYPGPRAFQVADAPIFFGRGLETRQLLRLLAQEREARLVIVAGRSGSGKTSLVQAGLLGSLSRGGVPGLEDSRELAGGRDAASRPGWRSRRPAGRGLDRERRDDSRQTPRRSRLGCAAVVRP